MVLLHFGRRSQRPQLFAFILLHRRGEERVEERIREERRFCSGLCVQRNSAVETTCNDQAIRSFTSKYTHRVRENQAQQSCRRREVVTRHRSPTGKRLHDEMDSAPLPHSGDGQLCALH